MTNTNEPVVPGTPSVPPPPPAASPAGPPPPSGPPIAPQSFPPAAPQGYAPAPAAPATRSTGKFVAGLILTILGGLFTLLGLVQLPLQIAAASGPAELAGRLIGGFLLWVAVLVVGIVLLRSSKAKVQ